MDVSVSLYEGEKIRLGPIDHEKDPAVAASWTQEAEYLRMLRLEPVFPVCTERQKKIYEKIEKVEDEQHDQVFLTIRDKVDDRLLGFVRLYMIEWHNAGGNLTLGIGNVRDRRHGYGSEALKLLLRFAFQEANLYRVSVVFPEYNQAARGLLVRFGFVEEVRRRQACFRGGQHWDVLHLGLLREEWEKTQ